jgi:hypothetical protein
MNACHKRWHGRSIVLSLCRTCSDQNLLRTDLILLLFPLKQLLQRMPVNTLIMSLRNYSHSDTSEVGLVGVRVVPTSKRGLAIPNWLLNLLATNWSEKVAWGHGTELLKASLERLTPNPSTIIILVMAIIIFWFFF